MTFVSYAQNFEDVLLWRALHDVEHGRYIDIGAQDPLMDSVSHAFYLAGWRGIHVEPTPFYAARLRDARPDETIIQAAVTDAAGPIEFYEIPHTGLSTGKAELANRHANAGLPGRKIVVPCVRLDQLLVMVETDLHWLKIDVEGMEADVLRSWRQSNRRPWLLVVESTSPSTQEPTEHLWIKEVLSRGYHQVFFDGLSRYFLHESHNDLAGRFVAPANVFDGFAVAASHFAAREITASCKADLGTARAEAAQTTADLQAELEESSRTAAAASKELECARTALEAALVAGDAAKAERDLARENETVARTRLAATEQEHGAALDALWRERQVTERDLRDELRCAQAVTADVRVQLARFEERSAHLQEMLRRSDETARESSEQLAQLQLVISRALIERPGRWERIGLALRLAKPRPAIQALTEWIGSGHGTIATPDNSHSVWIADSGAPMLEPPTADQRNPYLRANSLPELLSWHDLDFVRCAYVTVLGRQPDPVGEEYYVDRLRRGYSKFEILWQLRKSKEGPRHDPGIAGFDKTLRKHRNAQNPIFGWLVGYVTQRESNSRLERRLRAIENLVGALPKSMPAAVGGAALDRELLAELSNLTQAVQDALRASAATGSHPAVPGDHDAVRGRLSPKAQDFFDQVYAVSDPRSRVQ